MSRPDQWTRILHRWTECTADCPCSLPSGDSSPAQHSHDCRAHAFLKGLMGTRVWVLASPSSRATDYLRALRVWRSSPCFVVLPSLNVACFSCGQERTLVNRCCPERRIRKTILPPVLGEGCDGHTWPGDRLPCSIRCATENEHRAT